MAKKSAKKAAAKKAAKPAVKKSSAKKSSAKKAASFLSDLFGGHSPAAPSTAANVPATGFCIAIDRIREERRTGIDHSRTVSTYQCYWNGAAISGLSGQIVERGGPGDNTGSGVTHHRRIRAGTYRLRIQDGVHYKTYDYAASGEPRPGIAIDDDDTGARSAILIHPCHDAAGFLSSIGCLNPATGLVDGSSRIDNDDSRTRVIAIIDGMKSKMGATFPHSGRIPGALAIITGEPGL